MQSLVSTKQPLQTLMPQICGPYLKIIFFHLMSTYDAPLFLCSPFISQACHEMF